MSIRTITGDCRVQFDGRRKRTVRGRVVIIIKPDNTVLVHDIDGYQPVAWLTRADDLSVTHDPVVLLASDGDQTLRIEAAGETTTEEYDSTTAGTPVGSCRCDGQLVRSGGDVVCLGCADRFGLPSGASMTDSACECGLPRFETDRGESFELCLDYECESLLDAVRERFDREWNCPNCEGALRILRRGGLIAGCERYPDCDTGFSLPNGTVVGTCGCGLPFFETPNGQRCLDTGCSTDSVSVTNGPSSTRE